jgi:hypothetical protein
VNGLGVRLRRLLCRLLPGARPMACKDCWRHMGYGWRGGALDFLVSTAIWNYVIGGQTQTVYTIRPGLFEDVLRPRVEGVGGVVCLACFDRRARALNVEYRDHLIVFGSDCWMGGTYEGGMPL